MRFVLALLVGGILACSGGEGSGGTHIELTERLRLARPSDDTDLRGQVPASGERWIAAVTMAGVAVFDSSGAFVRELNAQGRGPGEFTQVQAAGFSAGDSLWALELFRAHLFTPPPELRFVRTVTFSEPVRGKVTASGFLSRGVMMSGDGLLPPNLRGWDGTRRAAFGPSGSVSDVEAEMGPLMLMDSTRAWRASGKSYALTLVDTTGQTLRTLSRTVEWFPPDEPFRGSFQEAKPPSRIADLTVGPDGALWILIRRAHPDWKPAGTATTERAAPVAIATNRLPAASDLNALFEVVLEVLDPDTGALLASRTLPGSYRGFVDNRHLAEILDDEDGHVEIRLWRLDRVEGRPR